MKQSPRWSYYWRILGIVVLGLVVACTFSILEKKRVKLEIGPETTYITEPRFPDGQIDYTKALHEHFSQGVKPEENAAVLIDRAFGPSPIPLSLRGQYFERTKTEPLPDAGNYVVTLERFLRQQPDAAHAGPELKEAIEAEILRIYRPWKREDCPLAAEWLDANAAPLKLIVEATRRPQYYAPVVSDGPLMGAVSTRHNLREVGRLLVARAMLRCGSADAEGAWSDLLACHRLASLASQRAGTPIQYLIAGRLDADAASGDAALIAHGLTSEQARKCLKDHSQLPPFARIVDTALHGERFELLENYALAFLESQGDGKDVNSVLRLVNCYMDDRIARLKSREDREKRGATDAGESSPKRVLPRGAEAILKKYDGSLTLQSAIHGQVENAELRNDARRELVRIGFALAGCRADRGEYPRTLDDLAGPYLDTIPLDPWTNSKFHYVPRDNGFLIYSIGPNGEDNGGQFRGMGVDDFAFEVPLAIDE